jgi:hypothetical protein
MKPFYAFLLVAGLFISGCDTLHTRQYEVSGVASSSTDAARLKSVLQDVADKSGLKASQSVSSSRDCLVYYTAGDAVLEASFYHDSVLIQLVGGYGTPPEYKQAKRLLTPALFAEFGSRFSVPDHFVQTP